MDQNKNKNKNRSPLETREEEMRRRDRGLARERRLAKRRAHLDKNPPEGRPTES